MFDGIGLRVIGGDHYDLGVEEIADSISDQIVNGLNFETRGEPLLNTVNDSQFRLALGKF
jgi:hypothetical protein